MHPALSGQPVRTPLSSSPPFTLRLAEECDLPALIELERRCFELRRRDTRRTIARGLTGDREVWILEGGGIIRASLFLRPEKDMLRIYSIATDPAFQGNGWGGLLLRQAASRAREGAFAGLSLEVDAGAESLLAWYLRHGFTRIELLPDFYGHGGDAWRLGHSLSDDGNA